MAEEIHVGTIYWDAQVRGLDRVQQQTAAAGNAMQGGANGGGGGGPNVAGGRVSPGADAASGLVNLGGGNGNGRGRSSGYAATSEAAEGMLTGQMRGGFGPHGYQYATPIGPGLPPGWIPPQTPLSMMQRAGGFARAAYNLGQTNIMGNGMLMNMMFGGWEVASSANAAASARRFAQANPGDLEGQMFAWNKSLDKMSGGVLGSMTFAAGGLGARRDAIDATFQSGLAGNAKTDMLKESAEFRTALRAQAGIARASGELEKSILTAAEGYRQRANDIEARYQKEVGVADKYRSSQMAGRRAELRAEFSWKNRVVSDYASGTAHGQYLDKWLDDQTAEFGLTLDTEHQNSLARAGARRASSLADAGSILDSEKLMMARLQMSIAAGGGAQAALNNATSGSGFVSRDARERFNSATSSILRLVGKDAEAAAFDLSSKSELDLADRVQSRNEEMGLASAMGGLRVNTLLNGGFSAAALRAQTQTTNNLDFAGANTMRERLNALARGASRVMADSTQINGVRKGLEEERDQLLRTRARFMNNLRYGGTGIEADSPDSINFKGGVMAGEGMQRANDLLSQISEKLSSINTALQGL